VRQRALWGGELDDAEGEGGHRREGMNRYFGRGIEQRREGHWKLPWGFIAKTPMRGTILASM
jgi:hypothetical protein